MPHETCVVVAVLIMARDFESLSDEGEEERGKEVNKCGQEMLTGSLPGQEVTTQQL